MPSPTITKTLDILEFPPFSHGVFPLVLPWFSPGFPPTKHHHFTARRDRAVGRFGGGADGGAQELIHAGAGLATRSLRMEILQKLRVDFDFLMLFL